jgi:NADPH-dependent 2,4-dienoyl-CoA reductase/sulfur reductase-like enzyme
VLGVPTVELDRAEGAVVLRDGSRVPADAVILATGATPRDLTLPRAAAGVHVLRTVDDAEVLRSELQPGARLVVVGAGFVGTEVATTAAGLGVDVTVVEAGPVPLVRQLGPEVGTAIAARFAVAGIALRRGHAPVRLLGTERVEGLELEDGTSIPADVVLLSIGAQPRTGWLEGSGLCLDDGVRCDATGATGLPGVVAVGDCACWSEPAADGAARRHEHWTSAIEQAGVAASRLLGATPTRRPSPPYVWSDLLGVRIRVAGTLAGAELHVADGLDLRSPDPWTEPSPSGAAIAVRDGTIIGALAVAPPALRAPAAPDRLAVQPLVG